MSREEPLHSGVPGLSPGEIERLAMLAEECSEIVQMVGKILRHGYHSYHPDRPSISNMALLERELGDLEAVVRLMAKRGDMSMSLVTAARISKMERAEQYLHYNTFRDLLA